MTHIELKERRKALGMSQEKLASLLYRTKDCIAKWESGKYPIPKSLPMMLDSLNK